MLSPTTEEELSTAVAQASGPLRIQGGGTRGIGGPTPGEVCSVAGITGITLYEPGALTLVAAAGTPVAEIEAALAAENQRLPFEPMDHRNLLGTTGTPTIGGVVSANVSGPRRIQAGACRDSLIGVRFVDGRGTVIKNGGRVMKNVTGYDLVKLMAGAHGTLGVLSEVAFKVLPAVERVASLHIKGLADEKAVAVLSRALGSPFEVSGAAHAPRGRTGDPMTLIRLEGFAESVSYRAARLKELPSDAGDITVQDDPATTAADWTWIRNVEAFAGTEGDVWRLSVKPSDGPEAAVRVGGDVVYDWGGGLIWARVPAGTDVRPLLKGLPGHATLVRGDSKGRAIFQPEPAPLAALSEGLRAKFDPRGILNPGLMAQAQRAEA